MQVREQKWRRIGWDGIILQVPHDWHPAAVHPEYLLFEDEHRPICAIKWQQVKGSFNANKMLNKLANSLNPTAGGLRPLAMPASWHPHLKPFIHQGFSWQDSDQSGIGLLLFNRNTQRSILLQFYGQEKHCSFAQHLLANLQDQQQQEHQLWSVFDICIDLPGEAKRTEHEFLPGSYRLHFTLAGHLLTYYRFKPAAELLRRQSLGDFGRTLVKGCTLERVDEPLLVQWGREVPPGLRVLERLRKKPICASVRLWQIPEENVILGLKVEGKLKMPEQLFETLCDGYCTC